MSSLDPDCIIDVVSKEDPPGDLPENHKCLGPPGPGVVRPATAGPTYRGQV